MGRHRETQLDKAAALTLSPDYRFQSCCGGGVLIWDDHTSPEELWKMLRPGFHSRQMTSDSLEPRH